MRTSIFLTAALATVALAAPSFDIDESDMPTLASYFQLLGREVAVQRSSGSVPPCDLTKATLPAAPSPGLPLPASNLILAHVALGRGIQNYTCDLNNATAVPTAIGAIATLYNASCLASTFPTILALLPNVTLQIAVPPTGATLAPASLDISGHHYFANLTTPFFDMTASSTSNIGAAGFAKNASVPAPPGAPFGVHGVGNGSVAWLQLSVRGAGAVGQGGLASVYRVNTAGGAAPKTCTGMAAAFSVEYAAEYWFYKSS